jgi:hypothetical protein
VPDFPLFSPLFSEEGKHFVKEIIAHTISYSKYLEIDLRLAIQNASKSSKTCLVIVTATS